METVKGVFMDGANALALNGLSLADLVAISPTAEAFEEHLVQTHLDGEEGEHLLDAFLHDDFHGALRSVSPDTADALRRRVALLREQKVIAGDPKRKGAHAAKLLVAEAFRGLNGEWRGLRLSQQPRALKWQLMACIKRLQQGLGENKPMRKMEALGIAKLLINIEKAGLPGTGRHIELGKMLLLLARLHAFEPKLVRDYQDSFDTSSADGFLTKLADIFAGFLRLSSDDLNSASQAKLDQIVGLERSVRAFEASLPWAKALFLREWEAFRVRLAEHGHDGRLGDIVRLMETRIRTAKAKLDQPR